MAYTYKFNPITGEFDIVRDSSLVFWNDIFIPLAGVRVPAVNAPTWTTFTTNLKSYTFAIDDYSDLATCEVLHGYKEGTDLEVHIHLITNGLNDATERKAKYIIYYSIGDVDEVMSAEGNLTQEITIESNLPDKTHLLLQLGDISGLNHKIGSVIKLRIKRISGTGTEPINDPFIEMVGIHYQINALGSRQELIK